MAALNNESPLAALRADFLATSTQSMPIAGMIFWALVIAAGMLLPARTVAFVVGFGSGAIFPLALLIDKLRGAKRRQLPTRAIPSWACSCNHSSLSACCGPS